VVHGALLDAELLSEVYIELLGGRQTSLLFGEEESLPTIAAAPPRAAVAIRPMPRLFILSEEERAAHEAAVARLGEKAIWRKYLVPPVVEAPAAVAAAS
jgi:DNA polymerase-3 subunit epsilon